MNMPQSFTRRQFGQIALAGTATIAIASFGWKTLAQSSTENELILYGAETVPAGTNEALQVETLDLTTGETQDMPSARSQSNDVLLQPSEWLSGMTTLSSSNTIVIASNTTRTAQALSLSRITVMEPVPRLLVVSGLGQNMGLESILAASNGLVIGLVGTSNGAPPYSLVSIDLQTGHSSPLDFTLPSDARFGTLTQCPDGKIYATTTAIQGETSLAELDLNKGRMTKTVALSLNAVPWRSGFKSLACASDGQLYALGTPRYSPKNSLYLVDSKKGEMQIWGEFDVYRMTSATV
jgi:hypothetical protein